ncbi:MAG: TrmH family RNA methyltransferase [Velocimicrobium sp.]
MISSASNTQIKEIQKLQKKAKLRNSTLTFVVEGKKMVEEARNRILKVYISESYYKEDCMKTTVLNQDMVEIVEDKIFREISETITPQGILAIVRMPQYNLEKFLSMEHPFFMLLEDLRDPGNLGTILRTAEGAGVDGVILSKDSVDLFNPKVVRSTMGSIFRMPFLYVEDFHKTLKILQKNGVALYATDLNGNNYFNMESYEDSCGIIIGNEANGITKETKLIADCLVKIPMEGKVESLNAAIAAALMMYEVYGQRREK